jgi:hypothetical protein
VSDDPRRHSGDYDIVRDWRGDHRSCADYTVLSHVGHDDSAAADPCAGADSHRGSGDWLTANRSADLARAVSMASARDVDAGAEQHVAFEVNQTQRTTRPDVGSFVETSLALGEERAERNRHGGMTAGQRAGEKRAAQVLAADSGNQGESLTRAFERAIFPDHSRANPIGRQGWRNQNEGDNANDAFDGFPHVIRVNSRAVASSLLWPERISR